MTADHSTSVVDTVFAQNGQGSYRLTRVHHVLGYVVRIAVERDYYARQSHARVEVLTPQLTWTPLAYTPPTEWHPHTPLRHADAGTLAPIADQLLERVRRILPATRVAHDSPASGERT